MPCALYSESQDARFSTTKSSLRSAEKPSTLRFNSRHGTGHKVPIHHSKSGSAREFGKVDNWRGLRCFALSGISAASLTCRAANVSLWGCRTADSQMVRTSESTGMKCGPRGGPTIDSVRLAAVSGSSEVSVQQSVRFRFEPDWAGQVNP
jgi:hypothetical protein